MTKASGDLPMAPRGGAAGWRARMRRSLLRLPVILSLALVQPTRVPGTETGPPPLPPAAPSPGRALADFVQAVSPEPTPPQPATPLEPERPEPEKPPEALLLERGAILLRQGTLQPIRAPGTEAGRPRLSPVILRSAGPRLNLAQAVSPEPTPPQPPTPLEPERPKPEKPPEALLLERGAILLPRGTLQLEPSFEYSYYSADRIAISGLSIFEAIIIGVIEVDSLRRNILTGALTARYGVLDRLQLDARVPFLYRRDEEVLGVGTANQRERITDNVNIGDVEASLSWQALMGRGWVPDLILRADGRFRTGEDPFGIQREPVAGRPGEVRLSKPPTGSGFYGVGPGLTAVWRSDPVVFFGGARYTFNLSRDVGGDFGTIDPGDSLEWLVGLNLAVSERVSVNLSFVDKITWGTEQQGRAVPGSSFNDARLVLGASIGLAPRTTLVVNAGVGLTEESPDFQFTVSVPFSFKLF